MLSFLKNSSQCPVCGSTDRAVLNIREIKGFGILCTKCKDNVNIPYSSFRNMSNEDIKGYFDYRDGNLQELEGYNETENQYIGGWTLSIDDNKKKWFFGKGVIDSHEGRIKVNPQVYSFSDLVNYELMKDGKTISSGGLGRAAIGGLAGGGIGALIGTTTRGYDEKVSSIIIRIAVNDKYHKSLNIDILDAEFKTDSFIYKQLVKPMPEVLNLLDYIKDITVQESSEAEIIAKAPNLIADELIKLKDLYESGILTKEEFERAKSRLLE